MTAQSGRDEFGVRRHVCRTVGTEDEAKRLDAKLQHEVYEGRYIKPSSDSMATFCQRFLDGRDKIAPATRSRYQAYLKHVKRDLGAVPLSRFSPRVAASCKRKQRDIKRKRAVLEHAEDCGNVAKTFRRRAGGARETATLSFDDHLHGD